MSATFTVLASLALASGAAEAKGELDAQSARFADTLVTAYTCDLLGYGVDYISLADWGHETREAMMAEGATYDEAMDRMQADVRAFRERFNTRYYSAIFRARFNLEGAGDIAPGSGPQQRFQKTYNRRCKNLANDTVTGAFFTPPEGGRLSSAEVSRKVRDLVVLARHGETTRR